MPKQRLHSSLAEIDVLTRVELEQVASAQADNWVRTLYRGLDVIRLGQVIAPGNGGTLNIGGIGLSDPYMGPEQGDVWLLRRAIVTSSTFNTDGATYVLFRGSSPSDPGQYTNRQLLDGQNWNIGASFTTQAAPAVPASTIAAQNTTNQAYTVVVTGGTLTAVVVNGITVGTAAGTYTVPAFGAISITYTVAPTWTWTATQTGFPAFLGQHQGVAYNPGSKNVFLFPGEQLYAQVTNSVTTNYYVLTGDAIRVPAEMKGKVL